MSTLWTCKCIPGSATLKNHAACMSFCVGETIRLVVRAAKGRLTYKAEKGSYSTEKEQIKIQPNCFEYRCSHCRAIHAREKKDNSIETRHIRNTCRFFVCFVFYSLCWELGVLDFILSTAHGHLTEEKSHIQNCYTYQLCTKATKPHVKCWFKISEHYTVNSKHNQVKAVKTKTK